MRDGQSGKSQEWSSGYEQTQQIDGGTEQYVSCKFVLGFCEGLISHETQRKVVI